MGAFLIGGPGNPHHPKETGVHGRDHPAPPGEWDFLAGPDMGRDRLHPGFWRHCDPAHPRYRPGSPYGQVFRDYYRALDRHLAAFLEVLPDAAAVVIKHNNPCGAASAAKL